MDKKCFRETNIKEQVQTPKINIIAHNVLMQYKIVIQKGKYNWHYQQY